jgi:hypothetical protein
MAKASWSDAEESVVRRLETFAWISRKVLPPQKTPACTNVWDSLLSMAPVSDEGFREDGPIRESFTESRRLLWDECWVWITRMTEIERHIVMGRAQKDSWKDIYIHIFQIYRGERLSIRTLQRKYRGVIAYTALYASTPCSTYLDE